MARARRASAMSSCVPVFIYKPVTSVGLFLCHVLLKICFLIYLVIIISIPCGVIKIFTWNHHTML